MTTEICSEELCTGCAACFNVCPQECISMSPDPEGFLRPVIDQEQCNDCGECIDFCPILHIKKPDESREPLVYACWNKDEAVRFQSASGGAFSAFAGSILDHGGVVFGAAFDDNMKLNHIAVERKNKLGKLRSSKYVQSDIGCVYGEVRSLLRQNRRVLFTGTPCQVAALHSFLGKGDENLLTCDMLCHGVPSPGLFAKYVSYLERRFQTKLYNINVRHKRKGWNLASTVAILGDGREQVLNGYDNSFMYGFVNCFSLRPACYRCPHTSIDRCGDITLGDFWGIGDLVPYHYSTRNGVSLILVNTKKGRLLFEESSNQLNFEVRKLKEAVYVNYKTKRTKLSYPVQEPVNRKRFFTDYQRLEYEELAKTHLVDKGVKGLIKRVIPRNWIFQLRKNIKRIRSLRHSS